MFHLVPQERIRSHQTEFLHGPESGPRVLILMQSFGPLKSPLNILVIVLLRKFSKDFSKDQNFCTRIGTQVPRLAEWQNPPRAHRPRSSPAAEQQHSALARSFPLPFGPGCWAWAAAETLIFTATLDCRHLSRTVRSRPRKFSDSRASHFSSKLLK